MARPVLVVLVAAVTAVTAGLALAGCGNSTGGTAAPVGASGASDPVAWSDQVCGAFRQFVNAATNPPAIDRADTARAQQSMSGYLGGLIGDLDDATGKVRAAGPAPVSDGDKVANDVQTALIGIRTSFSNAKAMIDGAARNDPLALGNAIGSLSSLSDSTAGLENLRSHPELEQAAQKAPNCQALEALGSSGAQPPTTPTTPTR